MKQSEAGFTLVELLVTLSLTAALATFVLGGIDLARRSWIKVQAQALPDEIDAAQGRLRELLARTMPANLIDPSSGLAHLAFAGYSDKLSFVTLSDASATWGGLMRVRLGVSETINGPSLVVSTGVFRASSSNITEEGPIPLFRHISDFSIQYFGVSDLGQPAHWESQWIDKSHLPQLVQLALTIRNPTGETHMLIPVALQIMQ